MVEMWGSITPFVAVIACYVVWKEARTRLNYLRGGVTGDKLASLQSYLGFPLSRETTKELVEERWRRARDKEQATCNVSAALGLGTFLLVVLPQFF